MTDPPTHLAVAITRATPPLEQQVATAVTAGATLIELRLDLIGDVEAVAALLRGARPVPFILTIRARGEGGAWDGDDAERIALYERLGLLLPGYVDVELATWQRSANLRQKLGLICERADQAPSSAGAGLARQKNLLILSHHDVRGTPAHLPAFLDALPLAPAAVAKAVFTADDARDSLRVLESLHRRGIERPWILLAMGPAGLATRVLARKFGGFLTFAAVAPADASAPGQPTLAELCDLYHWQRINAATAVYGVVGWPVSHSRSPVIHNAALRADGINAVYLPLPVRPAREDFFAFMDAVAAAPWLDLRGLSVTIPHKEHAVAWLAARGGTLTALARRCGAANTLTREPDGRWSGENTDASGFLEALARGSSGAPGALRSMRAAVLGAGGVARAVVAALHESGAAVTVYNRNAARAEALAAEFGAAALPWEARGALAADLLVNCTSVGMTPAVDASPLPPDAQHSVQVVLDTIYTPRQTRLLRDAARRGARTIDGLELFIAQAVEQYRRWHGPRDPQVTFRSELARTEPP